MDINSKFDELTHRLERVEQQLGIRWNPTLEPAKAQVTSERPMKQFARRDGFSSSKLLGFVAIICVVLAAAFIIKLAIDSGWLTPVRQIGLSAMIGSLLIVGGLTLRERDPGYAAYLPAGGIIILFLTIFGAHLVYGLIGQEAAVALSGAVSLLSIWLFTLFRSDIFPICAAIGSYAVPVIIGFAWRDFTSIAVYFLLWSTTFSVISVFVKSRTLSIVSSYFGVGLLGAIAIYRNNPPEVGFIAGMQALQFCIVLAGVVSYSIINRSPLTSGESIFLYPILVFFYASEYALLKDADPVSAPFIMLSLAAAVAGAFMLSKNRIADVKASAGLVEAYCLMTLFHALYLELLTDTLRPLVLVALLSFSVFSGAGKKGGLTSVSGVLVVFAVVLREYASIIIELVDSPGAANHFIWILYGVSISILLLMKGVLEVKGSTKSTGMLYFILSHSLVVATLYHLFEPIGSLPLSIAWTAYAGAILGVGFQLKNEPLAKSSLAVLFFAVGKVFTYDVQNASPVVRILCLFLTAAVLYGCGWMLRKIESWSKTVEG